MTLGITNVLKTYETYSSKGVNQPQKMNLEKGKADSMTLSTQAQDFQTVFKALAQVPDIREERVLDIQNRINKGEYNVSSGDIASKMLGNMY